MADGHQLRRQLCVYRHHLDQPPLSRAVYRSSDIAGDMDQLHPSLYGVAPAICDRVDRAHRTRVVSHGVLRRTIRVHRHRLQRLRARDISQRRSSSSAQAHPAHREAPIARCPCDFHHRNAGGIGRAEAGIRSDMRRPDPSPVARGPRQPVRNRPEPTRAFQVNQKA